MKRNLLPFAALVILVLATVSIVRTQPRLETNEPPTVPPHSTFDRRVTAAGLVEAASENISIASHLPGVVEKVFVIAGQPVKAGDPLVKLDTRALEAARAERQTALASRQAELGAARARVGVSRASLAEARRHLAFAEAVTDVRSISAEELSRRRSAVETASAEAASAEASVAVAEADIGSAEAALRAVATDLERSTVTAPILGQVLQVRIRPGEYAPAGPSASPWLVLGDTSALHIRVDIDEHEAWRVPPGAPAEAQVRGNANLRTAAKFVRFEPMVIPKTSLTGASTERVDTRVLQAIYRIEDQSPHLFVGQQMDVFIEASGLETAMANTNSTTMPTERGNQRSGYPSAHPMGGGPG